MTGKELNKILKHFDYCDIIPQSYFSATLYYKFNFNPLGDIANINGISLYIDFENELFNNMDNIYDIGDYINNEDILVNLQYEDKKWDEIETYDDFIKKFKEYANTYIQTAQNALSMNMFVNAVKFD